jgi:ABC-type multidrug transport system fused ATPase/permease subunit
LPFESPFAALAIVASLQLVPFMVLVVINYWKMLYCGTGSSLRRLLLSALLRKFLNYDQSARLSLRKGQFIMALTRDATVVVAQGYVNVMKITKEVGNLVLVIVYQSTAPFVFGKPVSIMGFMPVIVVPIIMFVFLSVVMGSTNRHLEERNHRQDQLANFVDETVTNYGLIADYQQRSRCTEDFEAHVNAYNTANRLTNILFLRNRYLAKWLNMLIVAGYIFAGGLQVLHGPGSLGLFLTNIRIFTGLGQSMAVIYDMVLEITEIIPALENVVKHMNMKLDLPRRKALNRNRRERTMFYRQEYLRTHTADDIKCDKWPIDKLPLSIQNLNIEFNTRYSDPHTREKIGEHVVSMSRGGSLRVEQGSFVCLVGPKGGGKSTVLKILGGDVLPNPECMSLEADAFNFFVPSHLNILHVRRAMFFYGTLYDNICYGCAKDHHDAHKVRVTKILRLLQVEEDVIAHLDKEDKCNWADVFSEGQCQLLSLARAFVMNPEVLCLHKPTVVFDTDMARAVTEILREYVEKKGVAKDDRVLHLRRPRTCIITSAQHVNLERAHTIYYVSQETGISLVDFEKKQDRKSLVRSAEGEFEMEAW